MQKAALVRRSHELDMSVSLVAREEGVVANLLFQSRANWIRGRSQPSPRTDAIAISAYFRKNPHRNEGLTPQASMPH